MKKKRGSERENKRNSHIFHKGQQQQEQTKKCVLRNEWHGPHNKEQKKCQHVD